MPLGQHVPAQRANLTTTSFLTSGLSNAPTRRLSLQVAMWRSSARQLARQSSRLFFPEQRSSAGETSTLLTSCARKPFRTSSEAAAGKLDFSKTALVPRHFPAGTTTWRELRASTSSFSSSSRNGAAASSDNGMGPKPWQQGPKAPHGSTPEDVVQQQLHQQQQYLQRHRQQGSPPREGAVQSSSFAAGSPPASQQAQQQAVSSSQGPLPASVEALFAKAATDPTCQVNRDVTVLQ